VRTGTEGGYKAGIKNLEKSSKSLFQLQHHPAKSAVEPAAKLCRGKTGGTAVLATTDIFLFEEFRLDRQGEGLSRRNERGVFIPVPIGLRALDVLGVLVERSGELVSKEEMMAAVWGRAVVESANLTVQISALRRVLDEGRAEGSCIQTVAARGYRFTTPVRAAQGARRANPTVRVPRMSIVVLPFANLSNDPNQQYFADGITDDLTTDLSRIENAFVISRNTAFTFTNKPVDANQIGRELGVRYLLEGSVRRSGDQIRVNAQLIDTETAAHIWAERFDRTAGDLFALQDEITSRIAVALDLELVAAEARRPTEHPDARDYIFRGCAVASKPPTRENYAKAIRLFECALAFDARSAEAQGALADVLVGRVLDEMTDTAAADIARAEDLIGRALAASPRSSIAHYAKGNMLRDTGRYEAAIPEYETVIELNRNEPGAYANLGWCKLLTGLIEEAIPALERALGLSPRDTRAGNWLGRIGLVHLLQSRTDEAILWLEKGRTASPALPFVHIWLASAYALKGAIERAALELAEARRLRGEGSYASIAVLRADWIYGAPKIWALLEATFFAGLRKAGMPEE
jgi:TolB-like protein/Tfp pilus assembly protein PilF